MSQRVYIPQRGDLVHMNWDSAAGAEWKGPHWALVLTDNIFHARTGLAIVIAITSKTQRDHPYEVRIQGRKVNGMILPIHGRTIDIKERGCVFTEKCPPNVLNEVLDKLSVFTHIDANSR